MSDRHIVAMGGGGFSMEPDNPLLDNFVVDLSGQSRPQICFIPTASGDAIDYIKNFKRAFPASRFRRSLVRLFDIGTSRLEDVIGGSDVIYVGGGSTPNLLALWRLHGLDELLHQAWQRGAILAGVSAGSICWFEAGVTDGFGAKLAPVTNGLGLLGGSNCPHYDGQPARRPAFQSMVQGRQLPPGLAADDGVGLHFMGTELVEVVSSRRNAAAYRVSPGSKSVTEDSLPTRYLGANT